MTATVLFYLSTDENIWVAHCLELDVVGVGEHPPAALNQLFDLMRTDITTRGELGDQAAPIYQAPQRFWDALERAVPLHDVGLEAYDRQYAYQHMIRLSEALSGCSSAILIEPGLA